MPSESWVGGDIAGLRAMASSLKSTPGKLHDIVNALSSKVESISGDAGWQGDAANQFTQKWSADSKTAGALVDVTRAAGDAIEELSSSLEALENALYNAAHEAQKQGVPVRPDGKPPMMAATPNPPPELQKAMGALQDYTEQYRQTMEAAKNARLVTEGKLRDIFSAIGPDGNNDTGLSAGQVSTVGGYLKSLYAIPGQRNRHYINEAESDLTEAKTNVADTRSDYQAEKQAYESKGMKLPKDNPARLAHAEASNALADVRARTSAAEQGLYTNSMSSALDTRVSELPKLGAVTGRLPSFLKASNALGVLGTGVGAYFGTKSDVEKGENVGKAVDVNAVSGLAGLGAGAVAAGALSAAPLTVSVGVGTLGAVVAGDAVKEGLDEHWQEDIHKHGVVGGVATGIGHTAENTAKDVTQLGTGIWNTIAP